MAMSEHFPYSELQCHGTKCVELWSNSAQAMVRANCKRNDTLQGLVNALEQFRALVGKPVLVNDAFRCPVHNEEVGGAPHSEHMLGLAADIRIEGMAAADLERVADQCPLITAIGRADHQGYIHIDARALRPGQARVRWCYDTNGKQTNYYRPP